MGVLCTTHTHTHTAVDVAVDVHIQCLQCHHLSLLCRR